MSEPFRKALAPSRPVYDAFVNRRLLTLMSALSMALLLTILGAACGSVEQTLPCATGSARCGDSCAVLDRDPNNCGACGNHCSAGLFCDNGACSARCGFGATDCAGRCVELTADPKNCGACGKSCAQGDVCNDGKCLANCPAGLTTCKSAGDGGGDDYCANVGSDNANCGSCGKSCRTGAACIGAACRYCTESLLLPSVQATAPGFYPTELIHADFDQDGKMDLAAATNINVVVVALGRGNGTFTVMSSGSTNVDSLAAGDFDGDGWLDLVTVGGSALLMYRGAGDGSFAAPKQLGAYINGPAKRMRATDLDGDGFLDILLVEQFRVSVFYGTGTPALDRVDLYSPLGTASAATADFDGDGHVDVAVSIGTSNGSVMVYHSDGARGFTPMTTLATFAGYPGALAVADFNKDGKSDLAIADSSATLNVWLGNGDGTFLAKPPTVGVDPRALETADFDGDGQVDLVAVHGASGDATILLGSGNGTFTPGPRIPSGYATRDVTVADLDGDARPDLAFASTRSLVVVLNGPNTVFRTPSKVIDTSPRSLRAIDFDGDGILDLGSERGIQLGKGDGTFGFPGDLGMFAIALLFGDLDGDTKIDWVGLRAGNSIAATRGDGKGGHGAVTTIPLSFTPEHGALGDVDGDAHLDLVLIAANRTYVLLGDGAGGFGAPVQGNETFSYASSVAVADVDLDGKSDVLVGVGSYAVAVMKGGPGGILGASTSLPIGTLPLGVTAVDIDGDAKVDIVTGNVDGTVSILRGKGGGVFAAPMSLKAISESESIAFGDVDGDGKGDLVVGVTSGAVVLSGNGAGAFGGPQEFVAFGTGYRPPVALGDFDKDGRTDVAVGQSLLLNRGGIACGLAK